MKTLNAMPRISQSSEFKFTTECFYGIFVLMDSRIFKVPNHNGWLKIFKNRHNDVFRIFQCQQWGNSRWGVNLKLPLQVWQKLKRSNIIERKKERKKEIRSILKKRENFWILNLYKLFQDGFNQELNDTL